MDTLEQIIDRGLTSIDATTERAELEQLRVQYLGKKGILTQQLKQLGSLPADERPQAGQAINRAKQSLQLVAPLRYHVTHQRRDGDKHVYGARSRFMTEALMKTMQATFHGRQESTSERLRPRTDKKLDVAARLREMF